MPGDYPDAEEYARRIDERIERLKAVQDQALSAGFHVAAFSAVLELSRICGFITREAFDQYMTEAFAIAA